MSITEAQIIIAQMKNIILNIINNRSGITSVNLALAVMERIGTKLSTEVLHENLEQLVLSGDIVQLEYIDDRMIYGSRHMYFKKGTKLLNFRGDNGMERREDSVVGKS